MDFTTFLKKESIQQLKHIVNQCINEIYLDAYLQTKKSNLVNNFYQSANEDYAQYRINQITSNLNQKLVEIFKNTKPNLIDSRKCPPHIQPNRPYIPVKPTLMDKDDSSRTPLVGSPEMAVVEEGRN